MKWLTPVLFLATALTLGAFPFSFWGSPLSVSLTQTSVSASGVTPVVTASVGAIPNGGVAPYTYSWVRTGGDANIGASSPTSEYTVFIDSVDTTGSYSATFTCTVHDNLGNAVTTGTLTVNITVS